MVGWSAIFSGKFTLGFGGGFGDGGFGLGGEEEGAAVFFAQEQGDGAGEEEGEEKEDRHHAAGGGFAEGGVGLLGRSHFRSEK